MRDPPCATISTAEERKRGYGRPKWNVMWCEGEDTRRATTKHARCNWAKREVTSRHNDKREDIGNARDVERYRDCRATIYGFIKKRIYIGFLLRLISHNLQCRQLIKFVQLCSKDKFPMYN